MSSKLKGFLIFFAGAIFSTWIGTFIANPLGDKIIDFFVSTPSKISSILLDHICSMLPRYETQNTSAVWAAVGIGVFCGFVLKAFNFSVEKNIDDETFFDDEDDDDFEEDIVPSKTRQVTDKILDFLIIVFEFLQKHIFNRLLSLFLMFGLVFITLSFFQATTITSIATDTLRRIEIVSPYINDLEYKQMRSDFFLIDNWNDYDQLDKKLDAIMEAEGISKTNK